MHQTPILSALCRAIGQLDIEAIVTTGDAVDPRILNAAPNTRVVRFVPHDAILPHARLVVTHAGHGTVMAALSHGVPLLLLPMGRDQAMIAARAAELGLGTVVNCHASADELTAAIEQELADRGKQSPCQVFRTKLAGHPALDDAISAVGRLVPASRSS